MSAVTRQGRHYTKEELIELARILAELDKLRGELLHRWLGGRARVVWIDKILYRAHKYYGQLRSALDEEWYAWHYDKDDKENGSPFFGKRWQDVADNKGAK